MKTFKVTCSVKFRGRQLQDRVLHVLSTNDVTAPYDAIDITEKWRDGAEYTVTKVEEL